ncbi:MAG: hypothetical protein K1000chlam2_00961 [Chlamydiae bacterium]|nr:hypothetical protein [Chlamydiota bacterium]
MGEMRVKAIKSWDKLLTWTLSPKNQPYHLASPLDQKVFQVKTPELFQFDENYGYFSIYHPIVGIVTDATRDIEVTNCVLKTLPPSEDHNFTQDEILAKVMAYRPLKKGMKIQISEKETYIIDAVIDLWHGMPAFGLVPEKKGSGTPLLLYRGTDLNLTSEKGWASILSDLDTTGTGHTTYLRARKEIRAWLEKMKKNEKPARVIGFSLGGVFVIYTLIYEYDLLNMDAKSVAFNPPGISDEVLDEWKALPEKKRPPHVVYVNQGDFVSQIGLLLTNVWELTLDHPMGVIESHVTLISVQPLFKMTAVDVPLENQSRE